MAIIVTKDGRTLDIPDLDQAFRDSVLQLVCPFCGEGPFRMLASHTRLVHGVGSWQLKNLAGLNVKHSLLAPDVREHRQEIAAEAWKERGRPKGSNKKGIKLRYTKAGQAEQKRKVSTWLHSPEIAKKRAESCKKAWQSKTDKTRPYRQLPESVQVAVRQDWEADHSYGSRARIARRYRIAESSVSRILNRRR